MGHLLVTLQFTIPVERKKYTRRLALGVSLFARTMFSEFGEAGLKLMKTAVRVRLEGSKKSALVGGFFMYGGAE
jgi:hypothetical protein